MNILSARYAVLVKASLLTTLVVAPLVYSTSQTAWAQTTEQREQARAAATAGRQAYDAGDYVKSIERFEHANSLVKAPPHLLYIARANSQLGKLLLAIKQYRELSEWQLEPNAPEAFIQAQTTARQELKQLWPRVPRLTVVLQGPGATVADVTVNNAGMPRDQIGKPVAKDPGVYRIRATSIEGGVAQAELTLVEGKQETVTLTFTGDPNAAAQIASYEQPVDEGASTSKQPPSKGGLHPIFITGIVGVGAGAIGAGVGAFLLVKGAGIKNDADDLYNECDPRSCTAEERTKIATWDDDSRRYNTIGLVSTIAGGALIAGGVTMMLVSPSKKSPVDSSPQSSEKKALNRSAPVLVMPWIGASSIGIVGTF